MSFAFLSFKVIFLCMRWLRKLDDFEYLPLENSVFLNTYPCRTVFFKGQGIHLYIGKEINLVICDYYFRKWNRIDSIKPC